MGTNSDEEVIKIPDDSLWAYYEEGRELPEAIIHFDGDTQELRVFHHGDLHSPGQDRDELAIYAAASLEGFHRLWRAGKLVEVVSRQSIRKARLTVQV